MVSSRNTLQRALVLETVNTLHCHATAEEVYQFIVKDYPTVSRATVYRNLDKLSAEGKIRRVEIPGDPDRFDHLCRPHYHFKCSKCGRIFDLEMEYMVGLESHVHGGEGFLFSGHDIIFRGLCPQCRGEDEPDQTP